MAPRMLLASSSSQRSLEGFSHAMPACLRSLSFITEEINGRLRLGSENQSVQELRDKVSCTLKALLELGKENTTSRPNLNLYHGKKILSLAAPKKSFLSFRSSCLPTYLFCLHPSFSYHISLFCFLSYESVYRTGPFFLPYVHERAVGPTSQAQAQSRSNVD